MSVLKKEEKIRELIMNAVNDLEMVKKIGSDYRDGIMDDYLGVFESYSRLVIHRRILPSVNMNSDYVKRRLLIVDIFNGDYILSVISTTEHVDDVSKFDEVVSLDDWEALPRPQRMYRLGSFENVVKFNARMVDGIIQFVDDFEREYAYVDENTL